MYLPPATTENVLIAILTVYTIIFSYALERNPQTQFGYSKFASGKNFKQKLPSFYGMLIIYSPAAIVSLVSLVFFTAARSYHVRLLALLNSLHYLKRIAEVLFVHKYSGDVVLLHTCLIAFAYTTYSLMITYLAAQVPSGATVNQTQVILGSILFFAAEATNHYHHLILATLRVKTGDIRYKIPNDGLFRWVWCPHYLGEIIAFLSLGLVSQNVLGVLFQLTVASYLGTRSLSTKAWYEDKFPNAPKRFALIPFVF